MQIKSRNSPIDAGIIIGKFLFAGYLLFQGANLARNNDPSAGYTAMGVAVTIATSAGASTKKRSTEEERGRDRYLDAKLYELQSSIDEIRSENQNSSEPNESLKNFYEHKIENIELRLKNELLQQKLDANTRLYEKDLKITSLEALKPQLALPPSSSEPADIPQTKKQEIDLEEDIS